MHTAFTSATGIPLPRRAAHLRAARTPICASTFRVPQRARNFGGAGAVVLSVALVNRLLYTSLGSLTPYQSRADIVAVVCGVSLLVYAAGAAEVADKGAPVEQRGTAVAFEATLDAAARDEAQFLASAALGALPNVRAVAVFDGERCVARQGTFRHKQALGDVRGGVAVREAPQAGDTKYFADLRVVPTREAEFGFLPPQCQAVVVVPLGRRGAAVFGADKVRPLTGVDFGWLTALCNRLGKVLEAEDECEGGAR